MMLWATISVSTFISTPKNRQKSQSLNSRLFSVLCVEMGNMHQKSTFQTEVKWWSRENVLSIIFELWDEIQMFHDIDKWIVFHDLKCPTQVAHLSHIFSIMNNILSLQGSDVTILKVQDKIKSFSQKCELFEVGSWGKERGMINFQHSTIFAVLRRKPQWTSAR